MIGALLLGDAGDYARAQRFYTIGLPIAQRRSDFQRPQLLNDRSLVLLASGLFARADAALRRYNIMSGVPPVFLERTGVVHSQPDSGELNLYGLIGFARYAMELGNDRTAEVFLRIAQASANRLTTAASSGSALRDLHCTIAAGLIVASPEPDAQAIFDSTCAAEGSRANARDPYREHELLLSRAALRMDRTQEAIRLARLSVNLRRTSGPPQWLASSLAVLGEAQCAAGKTDSGTRSLSEASSLYARHAPKDRQRVRALSTLGTCLRRAGRPREAAGALRRGMQLGEELLGDDQKQSDRSRSFETVGLSSIHAELSDLLVELGQPLEAFDVAERGRARAFRKRLAERSLSEGGPQWMRDLHAQRQRWLARVGVAFDNAQRAVDESAGLAAPERDRRVVRLHAIALQHDAMEADNRAKAPYATRDEGRRAGLEPATLDEVADALAPGTMLVEYSLVARRSHAFVIGRREHGSRLSVRTLPLGEDALGARIERLLAALQQSGAQATTAGALQRELYDALVGPIEDVIKDATRIVIVPDGALHQLPFGALARSGSGPAQYLVEWKPLHVAPSATGYRQLRLMPAADANGAIVAVADPMEVARERTEATTRGAEGGDLIFPTSDREEGEDIERSGTGALPGSRLEIRNLARIMGPGVVALVGRQANETRIKSLPPSTRILHFATHATINNALTANSGLTLARPESPGPADNGSLQGWEIVNQLRLRADLVVLSSCESAAGRRLAGEGVMSLSRAFHYSGARSVISTLWRIDDKATAALMTAFYTGLKAGLTKDEALRQAQIAFIRGAPGNGRWRHPAYWSAFQLSGDWQ
jgi:CHAT domain-containing protein